MARIVEWEDPNTSISFAHPHQRAMPSRTPRLWCEVALGDHYASSFHSRTASVNTLLHQAAPPTCFRSTTLGLILTRGLPVPSHQAFDTSPTASKQVPLTLAPNMTATSSKDLDPPWRLSFQRNGPDYLTIATATARLPTKLSVKRIFLKCPSWMTSANDAAGTEAL